MAETSITRDRVRDQLAARLIRYDALIPCTTAFVDTRTPGSEEKENFTIIGPGVAENPDQHVHIKTPHGFNIGGARQPPNCVNSQHSHETAEVFIVHQGRWTFSLGENAEDAKITLMPGDTISIPTNVFRGFENVGDQVGFLFAVLGGDDPGRVTWAPYVFAAARKHGLVLLENGALVDLTRGQTIPEGVAPQTPPTAADIARLRRLDAAALSRCVAANAALQAAKGSLLDADGIAEYPIIGAQRDDGLPVGKLNWWHGFGLRKLLLAPGTVTADHGRPQEEVLLMHRGVLTLSVAGCRFTLEPGDVMSIPVAMTRRYGNCTDQACEVYIVDGGAAPGGFKVAADAVEGRS